MLDLERIINEVLDKQVTDWRGMHGLRHWGRVYDNGVRLAEENGANMTVVKLFAFFHDSRRFNDSTDHGHGSRGAEYAKRLRGEFFQITDEEFELLYVACDQHTDGDTTDDLTIGTCWDADRLDLPRVGMRIDREYLSTSAARRDDILTWATDRAEREFVTDIVADIWHEW